MRFGWTNPVRIACTAATASTAPAAPMRCPIMLLVLLMRTSLCVRARAIARYSARSPAGVEVPWAFT